MLVCHGNRSPEGYPPPPLQDANHAGSRTQLMQVRDLGTGLSERGKGGRLPRMAHLAFIIRSRPTGKMGHPYCVYVVSVRMMM